jgi:hypothetical protein
MHRLPNTYQRPTHEPFTCGTLKNRSLCGDALDFAVDFGANGLEPVEEPLVHSVYDRCQVASSDSYSGRVTTPFRE